MKKTELSLKLAREMYNSDNEQLRKFALENYTEEELKAPEFKSGDWVISPRGNIMQISSIEKIIAYLTKGTWLYLKEIERHATPEEIAKATWKEGDPYLVCIGLYRGWSLKWSAKEYKHFYLGGKKKGQQSVWKDFRKLDINNLPVNE